VLRVYVVRRQKSRIGDEKPRYRTCPGLAITRLMVTVFKIVRLFDWVIVHSARMKKKELTPKQLSSVPCPTCGVAAGNRCVLLSGAPRSKPHVDRKFAATEAIEGK
jgi:hypothetical protein